ncbi:hypothetical protein [Nocardia sp. alder85J]|uniref:hypothetical protein n=1 Tax=Nocardia sp. alder85J TaxID=2862949 RepID=UPI001CD4FC9F|nr:hypothetical protein [Nocardia sp. alder85J]MCX4095374.1 hypothetical protein [Nocardia sp. alder85J]
MVLVAVAFALPQWRGQQWSRQLYAAAAPIFGIWGPHIGWGTGPAIAIAVLVVVLGPQAARRLSWGRLLTVAWLTSVAWTFALAMIDGWQVGFAGRLTRQHEYLWEVGGVRDIGVMLRGFSSRILDFRPDSWTTHVAGHPPGALLTFVLLDRIGLRGGAWAAWLCVLVGGSAVAAVAVALDALGAADRARAVLPLLVLAPAAVWVGVSADGFFAGVTAWAVALLAVATRQRAGWPGVALASGLLFGYGLYLNYGLTCMAIPAAAVLLARGFRPMLPALLGVALVAGAFTAAGFSWLDGYHLVVQRYYQGIASERPYSYWVWGNLAATVCAVGLATTAALPEVVRGLSLPALRWWRTGTAEPPDRQPGTGIAAALGPQRAREIPAAADRLRVADIAAAPGSPPVVGIAEPSRRGQGGGFAEALGRWRAVVDPAALLAAAGLVAIAAADLSGLSKAETERIWLPFDVWLLAATALLPRRAARWWLVTQAVAALLLNHLLATNW